ncbi:hypothetical protein D1841_02605 [Neglecta sp. X4]|nr:hypothetical protein [Neglectibacter sp. 59]NBJ72242.1 hypothetical protein [Neglectibacter sp. X4]NCE80005.1 hypothetical protein [Neglectibacter sp. X58]
MQQTFVFLHFLTLSFGIPEEYTLRKTAAWYGIGPQKKKASAFYAWYRLFLHILPHAPPQKVYKKTLVKLAAL